jgi:hypothetical protein
MFAYDGRATVTQQLIVVQQAAGDGILDGNESNHILVFSHCPEYLLERVAAYQLNLLVLEIAV